MDGHRYADESEPSWYSGSRRNSPGDPDVSGSHALGNAYDSGVHDRPSGAFRLPEQRPAYLGADPVTSTGSHARAIEQEPRVSGRGSEYPAVRRSERDQAGSEPTSLVPPVKPATAEKVYGAGRPVSSVVVAIVMVVLMVPVVRLLLSATFAGTPTARAVVPAVLLTLGFALSGIGLFAVAGGRPLSRESWLRPPVAYLPAGLLLLLAAGLAVA